MEYIVHFGLRHAPFSITPDPQFLYMSEGHREALAHVLYGAAVAGGFMQLTGEVGTGKTTICRRFLDQLPPGVDVALILNPRLTDAELLATICDELRIPYPAGTTSLKVLVDALYRHLLDAHAHNRRTVLLIDEAQNLTREVLEQLRLLTNLETPKEKLLQIILVGQPELATLLQRQDLRQLAQRITGRYHLRPFDDKDTRAYVQHRMDRAGQREPIFNDAALREVHRVSGGVPRVINVTCDRALLGAYAQNSHRVSARTVRRAAAEIAGYHAVPPRRGRWRWAPVVAVGVVALAGIAIARGTDLFKPGSGQPSGASPVSAEAPAPASVSTAPATAAITSPSGVADGAAPARGAGVVPSTRPLGEALADASVTSDRRTAFATLFAQWGHPLVTSGNALACETAADKGLRCLFRTGNWNRVRRFNLPAVIELTTRDGDKRYATVTAVDDERATLTFGRTQLRYLLSEIDRFWDGSFIVLWKPPVPAPKIIQPGMRAREVDWLRKRLAAVDGETSPAREDDVYDDALRDRVVRFQRSRSLHADGVVGEDTLILLTTAVPQPDIPILGPARL